METRDGNIIGPQSRDLVLAKLWTFLMKISTKMHKKTSLRRSLKWQLKSPELVILRLTLIFEVIWGRSLLVDRIFESEVRFDQIDELVELKS